ncbi:MAG: hypothetical protein WC707_02570 [Candidatus Babeliaceae bacterium]|jgi:hypothetical protein
MAIQIIRNNGRAVLQFIGDGNMIKDLRFFLSQVEQNKIFEFDDPKGLTLTDLDRTEIKQEAELLLQRQSKYKHI